MKKIDTHRFLLSHQIGKDGHMDRGRQDVNMKDGGSNFLSFGQANTWKGRGQQETNSL